ncbi:Guanine nucleotide-binding protein subunit alpha-11 [Bienertia sinuspersici]
MRLHGQISGTHNQLMAAMKMIAKSRRTTITMEVQRRRLKKELLRLRKLLLLGLRRLNKGLLLGLIGLKISIIKPPKNINIIP